MRRILVVATRQIGDVLLTTPLIRAARRRWPEAEIDVLGLAGTLGMLSGNPDVSATIEMERRGGWRRTVALLQKIWRRYDLALVTQPSDRAHLLGFAAAPLRSGVLPEESRHAWWKRRLLVHGVVSAGDRGEAHSAAEKLALLAPWQTGGADALIDIVPPASRPLPAALAAQLEAAPVVVHAPSMWRYKQWPLEQYAEVVRALLAAGHQVVLTGGPSAGDLAMVAGLASLGSTPRLLDAAGLLDWNQMATLLAEAALYIGPDTSATHLAAAVGVPVVTVFGPTNPLRWAPLGPGVSSTMSFVRRSELEQRRGQVVLLQGPGACVPCGRAGCEDRNDSASACLEAITAERVLAQAFALLAARAPALTA